MEEMLGAYGGRLIVAVIGVAIGLACLVGVLWLIRGRSGPSPFVRGGRNRQPRLQVLDATAVDARRRLVLIRRDDTEHLIMIGGPTDIVIESGIAATGPAQPAESATTDAPVPAQTAPTEQRKRAASPQADVPIAAREPAPPAPRPAPPVEPQVSRPAPVSPSATGIDQLPLARTPVPAPVAAAATVAAPP